MSRLVLNEYNMFSDKIKNERDIYGISDVHSDSEKLYQVKELLQELKASTLLIAGDLIDSTNDPRNAEIVDLLNEIARKTLVILVKGNHDTVYYGKDERGKRKEFISNDDSVFRELKTNDNIIVFDNGIEAIPLYDDLRISSVTIPDSWYENGEDSEEFDKMFTNDLKTNINRFNIALIHSPKGIVKDGVIKDYLGYLSQMNLFLSGHIHAGLMPIWARSKDGHQGIVGPYASWFPNYAHGVINGENSAILASGGITKIANSSEAGFMASTANKAYAGEIEQIHLIPGDENYLELNDRYKIKIH